MTVRIATAVALALGLAAAAVAITHGVPVSIVLPAAVLALLVVEYLFDRLEVALSREH
ncbi:hypothetical protein ACIBJF_45830 [Streptomyces sp. NPDC050743]|uniref:hypothetical protein n=1 Tax=Streptomyces sp. NPDC050743 TaxID=3365634 RepID=UPI00379BA83A